jgi:two-component system response regulator NreC
VDDHDIVRSGLRMLLMAEDDIEIVGEASSGQNAINLVQQLSPDVVVMDLQMPDMNGIEATRRIKSRYPDCYVLALTIHEDQQYFFQMLAAGASGYVPAGSSDDLVRAIRVVNSGHVFLYPDGLCPRDNY